jgi:hypothetical protein
MEASTSGESATTATGAGEDSAIRPFTIDVPEEQLEDLRSRINASLEAVAAVG